MDNYRSASHLPSWCGTQKVLKSSVQAEEETRIWRVQLSGELPGWASAIRSLETAGFSIELQAIDPERERVIPTKGSTGNLETLAEAHRWDTVKSGESVQEASPALAVPSAGLLQHSADVLAEQAKELYETRYDVSALHPKLDVAEEQIQKAATWFETKGGRQTRRSTAEEGLSATVFLDTRLKQGPVMFQGSESGIGEIVAHEVTAHVLSWALLPEYRTEPLYGNVLTEGAADVYIHSVAEKALTDVYASYRVLDEDVHRGALRNRFGWK